MFCVFELLLVLVLFTEMCLWQVSQSWLFIVEISHLGNVWREVSMCRESNLIILVLRVRLSRHLSLWAAAATLPRQKAWERIANAVANALQASLKVKILKVFYCWKSSSWKSGKEQQMLLPTPCNGKSVSSMIIRSGDSSGKWPIVTIFWKSHLAPDPIRSFIISKLPDSAQSCKAVFPFTDLRFTSAPMSIRYLTQSLSSNTNTNTNTNTNINTIQNKYIFHWISLGNLEVSLVAGDHEACVSVPVRHLDVCNF